MDFWFNALNNNDNNNSEEEDEKKKKKKKEEEEEEFFQSPMKPSPPVVVRDEKNANEEEEEGEKKSDSRGSSGHHRQSVLSPMTTTSTISTTTGGGYSSEYNSSPETTSELKSKKIGDENDNLRGREGAKVINRRSSTEKYMLTKESFDVTTKEKNGEDDGAEGDDAEGILRDDEQGMHSSILYENPDHTLVEEDEEEREEEEEGEDVEKEVEVVEKKKKQKKSENNKKKITRVERLREYFKLPPDEELLDEFLCALHKKILLQGRMYVFNNYVCFYSSVFGYQKRKRIPFKDVTLMEKAKTAGIFNNALYIVHQGGKREFFTSFIFPDKVFKFLEQQWRTSSDYGRLFRGHRGHESMDFDATLRRREEQVMLAQLGDSDQSDTEENSEEKKISNMLGTQSWTDTPVNDSELTHEQMKSLRRRRRMSDHRESVKDDTDDLSSDNTATTGENTFEDNEVTSETKRRARTPDLTTSKLYLDRKEDRRKENGGESGEEVANDVDETDDFGEIPRMHALPGDEQDESARIPAECGKGLVSAQFDCTPKEFFKACFSNSATSTFFCAQTKASGMTDFSCTEWAKHSHYGFSRDVKFVAPVNSTFGPKETRCVQTQTYKLYPDDNLIIGYSQVQLDIPYGDYFSVESKWNCVPISSEGDGKMNGCEVTFYVHVVFEKYTYLQSVIQSSVISETKASAESFLNAAKELLNNKGGVISEEKSATFLERLSKRFSIDVTKVKIPEGSRDAVFSMLYPSAGKDSDAKMRPASTNTHQTTTSSFAKKSTKDKLISGARRVKELAKQFFGLFTIQNLLMFVLFMVVAWTLLAICASCAQKLWYVVKYPFVVVFGDSDANVEKYWERRITILTQELGALERKVQLVSKEITHAEQSLKKASGS